MNGSFAAGLVSGALLVVFMAQNTASVTLHFLFWNVTWPLWLFTLLVALLGAVVGVGLGVVRRHRRRRARLSPGGTVG